jgi:indolepyruvate decarboxylase
MSADPRTSSPSSLSLGEHLVARLHGLAVRHAFGIPGDYALGLFQLFEQSPIKLVGATSELCAGYAADAYARITGLGVALVTYGVGGLSMANVIACAYAEKSPVVLISGAPGLRERRRAQKRGEQLHHTVGGYDTQRDVFARLTCASAVLDDPQTAFGEIDRVLATCRRESRPVYLEIPRDRLTQPSMPPQAYAADSPSSDPHALSQAVGEAVVMLRASRKPALLAGIEIARFRLHRELMRLAETARIPLATLLLSKSVVPEQHPLYVGLYGAAIGLPEVTRFVEESDCLLMLGTILTDFDTGVFTHNLDDDRIIRATDDRVRVGRHEFDGVRLGDFLHALMAAELRPFDRALSTRDAVYPPVWRPDVGAAMTVRRLLQKINHCLDDQTVLIADPGDTLLAAADLRLPDGAEFLAPAFYATLGWAVPAAVGAQLARAGRRAIVLVGDGAFQMTGTELGTARRLGLNPIIIVLNNQGYLSERILVQGEFNEIPDWNYHRLPEYLGAGRGFDVRTEDELETALSTALADRSTFHVLNVRVARDDTSPAVQRLSQAVHGRR